MGTEFHSHPTVLIIGAGPVGLLTALRLGRAQIPTLVLERHTNLLPTTRAVVYQPVVLPALRSLGILSHIESQAFLNHDGIVWRDISGAQLANMPISGVKGEGEEKAPFDGVLLIGQARMNDLILEELRKCPSVEVRFGHQLVGLEQHPERGSVTAMVHKTNPPHDDEVFIEAEYVVGTDGANSTVRRLSCIPFEGFTWNEFRMIGADVYYDFAKENGYTPLNFIVHPQEWAVIVYTGQDRHGDPYGKETPLWRVAYGESREMSEKPEEIMERAKARLQRYAKGSTDIEIKRAEPYNLHQRCAKQARKGRVLLAGDALHSNNPIGGLGLTTGILDAVAVGNALTRVIIDGEPDSLLTECVEYRQKVWLEQTNPASTMNLKRLFSEEQEVLQARENFFRKLQSDREFAKQARAKIDEMGSKTFANGVTV